MTVYPPSQMANGPTTVQKDNFPFFVFVFSPLLLLCSLLLLLSVHSSQLTSLCPLTGFKPSRSQQRQKRKREPYKSKGSDWLNSLSLEKFLIFLTPDQSHRPSIEWLFISVTPDQSQRSSAVDYQVFTFQIRQINIRTAKSS